MACADNQDDGIIKSKSLLGLRPKNVCLQPIPANAESKFEDVHNITRIVPLAEVEKHAILNALDRLKGNKLLTARALGIGISKRPGRDRN